jgi:hypothetical protein
VCTNGEKNIDWIDTDNRLSVKKHRLDRWSLEENNLKPMVQFYGETNFGGPMIDTVS